MGAFLSVAGTQLVLPDYARVDLAYSAPTFTRQVAAGSFYAYTTSLLYVEIPLTLFAQYFADATAGNRAVYLVVRDGAGNSLTQATAPTVQAPGTTFDYSFNVGNPFAYGPVGGTSTIGMPACALMPGYTLNLEYTNGGGADNLSYVYLTTLRVPVGPQPRSLLAAPIATPVLV